MSRKTIDYKAELFMKNVRGLYLGVFYTCPYVFILAPPSLIIMPFLAGFKTALDIIGRWRPMEKEQVEDYAIALDEMPTVALNVLIADIRHKANIMNEDSSNSSKILNKLLTNAQTQAQQTEQNFELRTKEDLGEDYKARSARRIKQNYPDGIPVPVVMMGRGYIREFDPNIKENQTHLLQRAIIKSYFLNYKNYGKDTHKLIGQHLKEQKIRATHAPAPFGVADGFIKKVEVEIARLHKKSPWYYFNAGCKTKALHIQKALIAFKAHATVDTYTALNEALCEIRIPNQGTYTEAFDHAHESINSLKM